MSHSQAIQNISEEKAGVSKPVLLYQKMLSEALRKKAVEENKKVEDKAKDKLQVSSHENEEIQRPALKWELVKQKGKLEFQAIPNTLQTDVTTVSVHEAEVKAPWVVNFFNHKIDVSAKVGFFRELYQKNYALSRSHNLLVARFAELKVAFLGATLSMLGVSPRELESLQEETKQSLARENRILKSENTYNLNLVEIIGGPKKKIRAQLKAFAEIGNQLMAQAKRVGIGDEYSAERMLELNISQCQKIHERFLEEKKNIEYQLAWMGEKLNESGKA